MHVGMYEQYTFLIGLLSLPIFLEGNKFAHFECPTVSPSHILLQEQREKKSWQIPFKSCCIEYAWGLVKLEQKISEHYSLRVSHCHINDL